MSNKRVPPAARHLQLHVDLTRAGCMLPGQGSFEICASPPVQGVSFPSSESCLNRIPIEAVGCTKTKGMWIPETTSSCWRRLLLSKARFSLRTEPMRKIRHDSAGSHHGYGAEGAISASFCLPKVGASCLTGVGFGCLLV